MNENLTKLNLFLNGKIENLSKLVEAHPEKLTVKDIAEFLKIDEDSVRAAIENGVFGMAWRKSGAMNKAYSTPTAQFVWWYTGCDPLKVL